MLNFIFGETIADAPMLKRLDLTWQQTAKRCVKQKSCAIFTLKERRALIMEDNEEFLEENKRKNRLDEYKSRSVICNQETRRLQLLLDQKRKREQAFNEFRRADLFSGCDDESDLEEEEEEEAMEWFVRKPKQSRLKDMFMLSEWMETLPEDFQTKWLFVFCPVGKRCLVHCSKGKTSVYGRRGSRFAQFQSPLPNGGQKDFAGSRYSNAEVTILDCIWSPQNKCYFVLDLLSWKGQFCTDTEMSFRVFWIKSKFEETPELSERSDLNSYPFIPLNYYPCHYPTILHHISHHPYFPANQPKVDGILFYHSQAHYTPGTTPLVLWLKPFMLPELLNVAIPDAYEQMKPAHYVSMEAFIMDYENRKRKKRRNKGGSTPQVEEGNEGMSVEVNMSEAG